MMVRVLILLGCMSVGSAFVQHSSRGILHGALTPPFGRNQQGGQIQTPIQGRRAKAWNPPSRAQTPTMLAASGSKALATGLGWLVGGGSLLLYTPTITRVTRDPDSAEGLALTTWLFKLFAYSASTLYHVVNGFPLSSFIDTACVMCQTGVIVFLVARLKKKISKALVLGMAAYAGFAAYTLTGGLPHWALLSLQGCAAAASQYALIPQLWQNQRRGSSGSYSAITAMLATGGCAIRIFTTIQLTGDPLLLAGFCVGLFLNFSLLSQIVYFSVAKEGKSLREVMLADYKPKKAPN